jgi:penicillin-binding protein 1A
MARPIRPKSRQEAPEPPPRRRNGFVRFLLTSLKIGLGVLVIALIALAIAVGVAMSSLPGFDQLKSSQNGQMIRVHAADGTVLVSIGPSYGQWLRSDQIPQVMKDAMVSVEDRRFYKHPGIDPIGIMRSVEVRFQRGHWSQGGSTITQQLARNVFLTNSKTWTRKIREQILALAIERKFSKDEILELYLNKVYFGGGSYGIDAASRKFFGHGADQLSLPEAAIIAGLVKAPSNYSPTADAQAAIGRASVVLQTMVETGRISEAQSAAANPSAVKLAPEPRQNSVRYFTDWALPQLETLIDDQTDPLDVWTTLDIGMQRQADHAIQSDTPAGLQGALVSMERDGAVRAMVGGKDYISSIYNRATQAVRQPGSSWKLFVYLAAIEAGHKPDEAIVDEPVTIDGWSPRNDERKFAGQINIRTAFAFSLNTVAAKLGQMVGFDTVADMARRFGITTPINTHPSMVLGTSDVRLIDMTRAFAEVDNKGTMVVPYAITKVVGPDNRLLYQHTAPENRVLVAPWVAAEMTDLLQTAVNTGTGRAAQIGRPVAGKTGTTSTNRDGWFLGFSSGLTTGVWMGRDDAKPNPGLYGGRAPAHAFADYMKVAVATRPIEPFDTAVTLPEWQLEPDDEAYYGQPDNGIPTLDENGQPVTTGDRPTGGADGDPGQAPNDPDAQQQVPVVHRGSRDTAPAQDPDWQGPPPPPVPGQKLDQHWLDGVLGRNQRAQQPAPRGNNGQPPQPTQ